MPLSKQQIQALLNRPGSPISSAGGGLGDTLLSGVGTLARAPLTALGIAGDVLSRPSQGLSEAYGEVEAGGGATDALEGLLRGITSTRKGLKYPSIAERIVPVEKDERLSRKVARFGADIATDPLSWLPVGLGAKVVGKAGIKAARSLGATKLAKTLGETGAAQSVARAVAGLDYSLERYGGRAGKWAAKKAARGHDEERALYSAGSGALEDVLKTLRVKPKEADAIGRQVTDVLETGKLSSDPRVNEAARFLRKEYDDWRNTLRTFRDKKGQGFMEFDIQTGQARPFQGVQGPFAPQVLTKEAVQRARTASGLRQEAKDLAAQLNITTKEAVRMLEFETGRVKRAGNIEYLRHGQVPAHLLERNAFAVYDRYLRQSSKRLAYAKQFGVEHKSLNKALEMASDKSLGNTLSTKTIEKFRNAIEGRYEESALAGVAPKILGYQVLTKMGPTSTIAQLSQHSNTIVAHGLGSFVKGLWRVGTNPAERDTAYKAIAGQVRGELDEFMGKQFGEGAGGHIGDLATGYLKVTQFARADRGARIIGAASGKALAERLAADAVRTGKGLTDDLAKRGITQADLQHFAQTGKFSPDAARRIGAKASEITQFAPSYLSLPPMWQTPEMRIAMQFRSFIHQQTRFLHREIMKPAIKWVETDGKAGDIKPLLRALIAYPVAGQGVAAAREFVQGNMARFGGVERKKERKFDYDHPIAQLAKDSIYVGAFGMAGDILQQAAQGRLGDYLLGPTITDITGTFERGVKTVGKAAEGEYPGVEDVLTTGARHVPFRRVVPLTPQEIAKGLMRLGR